MSKEKHHKDIFNQARKRKDLNLKRRVESKHSLKLIQQQEKGCGDENHKKEKITSYDGNMVVCYCSYCKQMYERPLTSKDKELKENYKS